LKNKDVYSGPNDRITNQNNEVNVTEPSPDPLKESKKGTKKDEIAFSNKSESYCVGIVDVIGSTQITSKLYNSWKIKKFYTVFINEIANIVKLYHGRVLKTMGDGVIFFFPQTSTIEIMSSFKETLECLLAMISSRQLINNKLNGLMSDISYRISADYGKLEVATSGEIAATYDLFGPTINFCAKINKKAAPNQIVVGADLWTVIKSFPQLKHCYHFREIKELSWKESKYSYPVYILQPNTESRVNNELVISSRNGPIKEKVSNSKVLTIMLIDDDPSISFSFTECLRSAGMFVDSFTDPKKALEHFIKSDYRFYDLVITDVRMSNLNGFQLYEQLKAFDPEIQIIFITALDIPHEIIALLPGVNLNQFIIKPINPSVLINRIRQHATIHMDGL